MVAGVFSERQHFAAMSISATTRDCISPDLVSQSRLSTSPGRRRGQDQAQIVPCNNIQLMNQLKPPPKPLLGFLFLGTKF